MRQISAQEKVIIPLGRQGENGAAEIIFDVSGWADLYGTGAFELLNRRPAENTPYTCSITVSNEQVHWIVQSADVALVGHGRCELTYVVDDVIAKSVVFATCVLPSIEGAGEVPEPYESRIQDLIVASAEAVIAAQDSEAYAVGKRDGADVPSDDPAYHNNSKYYSSRANSSANTAQGYASDAGTSAAMSSGSALKSEGFAVGTANGRAVASTSPYYHNNSKYYSEQASESAAAAAGSATAADGSASAAAGSATAADESATAAAGSETAAAGSATAAAGSASAAAGSATAAAGSASDAAAQLALVTAEGTRQVGLITAEGTTQKNAVIAKGQEVIESIPEDYSDLTSDVEDLKSSISQNGNFIISPGTGASSAILNVTSGSNANTASGDYSYAEGFYTSATGTNSHAEGDRSTASGESSHAEGTSTTASGRISHAEGLGTIANHVAQRASGAYNVADPSTAAVTAKGNYIEIVGNGTSNSNRSNARTLDWDGNEVLAGNLTVEGGSITVGQTTFTENQLSAVNKVGDISDYALNAYATDTDSGSIATFEDGADNVPVKELTVYFEPIQNLHGYDNPWPAGGGKNLLPMTVEGIKEANTSGTWVGNSYTYGDVTFEIQTDDANNVIGIKANNTAKTAVVFWLGKIDYVSNTQLYMNAGCQTGDASVCFRMSGFGKNVYTDANIIEYQGSDNSINLSASGELWGNVRVGNGKTVNNLIFKPYVFSSANPMTTFAPYSNICPISGHTECNVMRTGKNLCPTLNFTSGTGYTDYIFIDFDEFPSYMFSCSIPSDKLRTLIHAYDIKKKLIARMSGTSGNPRAINKASFTYDVKGNMDDAKFIRIQFYSDQATADDINNGNVQVETGSTVTTYESYRSDTYHITFPDGTGTVYGGNITVNQDGSGELVVTHKSVNFGTLTWGYNSTNNYGYVNVPSKAVGNKNVIATAYKTSNASATSGMQNGEIKGNASNSAIYIKDTRFTSAEEYQAGLDGVIAVYELATPITISLTAKQVGVITSLYGVNNFWADTGDVDVTIRADTQMFINARDKAITQSIAPIENGATASNAYSQGDYFFHNAKFCKALTAIASGATFTLNTNYAETTVAEELATILNV